MKKVRKRSNVDTCEISEFDFSKSWRNPYAKRFKAGTNIVKIEPRLMKYFPDGRSVNAALRSLVQKERGKRKRIAA